MDKFNDFAGSLYWNLRDPSAVYHENILMDDAPGDVQKIWVTKSLGPEVTIEYPLDYFSYLTKNVNYDFKTLLSPSNIFGLIQLFYEEPLKPYQIESFRDYQDRGHSFGMDIDVALSRVTEDNLPVTRMDILGKSLLTSIYSVVDNYINLEFE